MPRYECHNIFKVRSKYVLFLIVFIIFTLSSSTEARLPWSRNSDSNDNGEIPEDITAKVIIQSAGFAEDSAEDIFLDVPSNGWASRSFPSRIVQSARVIFGPPRLKCFLWGERDILISEYGSDASSAYYGTIGEDSEDMQAMHFITPPFTQRRPLDDTAIAAGPMRQPSPLGTMPQRQREKMQRLEEDGKEEKESFIPDLYYEEVICHRHTAVPVILLELASTQKEIHTIDLVANDRRYLDGTKIFSLDSGQGTGENVVKAALLEVPHRDVRCVLVTKDGQRYRLDKPLVQPVGDVDYLGCQQYRN